MIFGLTDLDFNKFKSDFDLKNLNLIFSFNSGNSNRIYESQILDLVYKIFIATNSNRIFTNESNNINFEFWFTNFGFFIKFKSDFQVESKKSN